MSPAGIAHDGSMVDDIRDGATQLSLFNSSKWTLMDTVGSRASSLILSHTPQRFRDTRAFSVSRLLSSVHTAVRFREGYA